MTNNMSIPEHLYVNGVDPRDSRPRANSMNDASLIRSMHVPDRIVLGGGGTRHGSKAEPTEVMADRVQTIPIMTPGHEVPSVLTAEDLHHSQVFDDHGNNAASVSSIAIEDDPLQELKKMSREMRRLTRRVDNLEDESKDRIRREYALWSTLVAVIVSVAALFARRR